MSVITRDPLLTHEDKIAELEAYLMEQGKRPFTALAMLAMCKSLDYLNAHFGTNVSPATEVTHGIDIFHILMRKEREEAGRMFHVVDRKYEAGFPIALTPWPGERRVEQANTFRYALYQRPADVEERLIYGQLMGVFRTADEAWLTATVLNANRAYFQVLCGE